MPYPQRPYLVEKLFPTSSFNLIGGSSGAGKTRLIFQMVFDMLLGNSIFGLKILQPIRPIYFCFDRLLCQVEDILNDMKLEFGSEFPIISKRGCQLITKEDIGDRNFVILDGIDFLVPMGKIIDLRAVADLTFSIQDISLVTKAAMVGVLGSPKGGGPNGGYQLTRELFIGSTAWGRTADNGIVVDTLDDDKTDTLRTLHFAIRIGGGSFSLPYQFSKDGWLRPIEEPSIELSPLTKSAQIISHLWTIEQPIRTTDQLESLIQTLDPPISRATLYRCLEQLQDHKIIQKTAFGEYALICV